uniref:Type III potassium channel toxin protein n=1 Tax=Anemonia sulcata TaxID=6108 RepID=A0A0S1M163_ANESU|nr:type III potassium channel toxin protein [Anemonia sulcata]
MTNKVLLILVFCLALVFLSNGEERVRVKSRAYKCHCGEYEAPPYGDWWFWRGSCPDGHGYKRSCRRGANICCFPRDL